MANKTTPTESRALELLGQGVAPAQVAAALGVTSSAISQLLADPVFVEKVASLRFETLRAHSARDALYDVLEDTLLERLADCIPLMYKPAEILKAVQVINAAKRRGTAAPITAEGSGNVVVNITLPQVAVSKFVTDINNQVIQAGSQQLLTIQSGSLMKKLAPASATQKGNNNVTTRNALPQIPRLSIEESLGM